MNLIHLSNYYTPVASYKLKMLKIYFLIIIKEKIDNNHFQNKSNKIYIIDAPPGTSCPVIESIKESDYTLLVTEPTPFGLHDLKLAVEVLKKLRTIDDKW